MTYYDSDSDSDCIYNSSVIDIDDIEGGLYEDEYMYFNKNFLKFLCELKDNQTKTTQYLDDYNN